MCTGSFVFGRKVIKPEGDVVSRDIDLQHLVHSITALGELLKRLAKQKNLFFLHYIRHQYHEPGVQISRGVKHPEVAGIVRHQHKIVPDCIIAERPVFPTRLAQVGDMMGLLSVPLRFARQLDREAFINEKSHDAARLRSGMRTKLGFERPCHGCLRGRPRRGWAAA